MLGVNPANFDLPPGQSALFNQAALAWSALNDLVFEEAGAQAQLTAAGAGTAEDLAAANARLAAVQAAIYAAGFDDVSDVITARDNLGGAPVGAVTTFNAGNDFGRSATVTAGSPAGNPAGHAAGASGKFAAGSSIGDYDILRKALNSANAAVQTAQAAVAAAERSGDAGAIAASNGALATKLSAQTAAQTAYDAGVDTLRGVVDGLVEDGLRITGNTVTAMIGALNDRDTDLADRSSTLNQVRAEMLTAAEVQFGEINDFANANTSGDFVAFFQVGANQNQGIQFDFESVSRTVSAAAAVVNMASILVSNPGTGSGIGRGIEVSPLIQQIQNSLDDVNTIRANLGAVQNRMDFTMRSLDISSENLQDSESRVRNADVAREMMRFTMSNVLQQAAVSMLSQANQLPQNLLQLLR
jgi:flagellin